MSDPDDLELAVASPTDEDAAALVSELNTLLDALYRPDDNHFRLAPGEVSGARGVFLVARREGEPIGCGAVRILPDGRGEIKRMYVRPGARSGGVGRRILERLEAEARRRGARALVLEMGSDQPAAAALYRGAGFTEIECWGEYLATPASVCLGKDLTASSGT
jgi:putative acetyltransferase